MSDKPLAPKKPRKPKVQPSREQMLAECIERIAEVNQEITELMTDHAKIANMGLEAINQLVEDALDDANQELCELKEEEQELNKPAE